MIAFYLILMILLEQVINAMIVYSLALVYRKEYVLLNRGIALKKPHLLILLCKANECSCGCQLNCIVGGIINLDARKGSHSRFGFWFVLFLFI